MVLHLVYLGIMYLRVAGFWRGIRQMRDGVVKLLPRRVRRLFTSK
jgi:hypothetical protein